MHNSESMIDDLSSLGQDLMSTMLGEKYDSVRECIETENAAAERPRKYCSLAQFVEGNDIARRSFKRPARYMNMLIKEVRSTCNYTKVKEIKKTSIFRITMYNQWKFLCTNTLVLSLFCELVRPLSV